MKSQNRFDVQVVFSDCAFGIKTLPGVELTPTAVAGALEEFCARVRDALEHQNRARAEAEAVRRYGEPDKAGEEAGEP